MVLNKLWKIITAFLFVFFFIRSISSTYGSGFALFTHGASSLAQGDAVIAHADNPSTIFFNSALINKLEGTQIEAGATAIIPYHTFTSDATENTFHAENEVFYLPTLFVTHKFNEKVSAGVGLFNPFGLGIDWGDDWEGRYITTNTEFSTFTLNPVVSYQITPTIAFAGGADFLLLDTTLEKKVNLSSFGLPDANEKFKGDGYGVGYNLGILYDITRDVSIGISYRSAIKVDIDGNANYDLPAGTPSSITTLFPHTDAHSDITLPQQVFTGICYKGFNPLTLEAGLRWEGWSSFDELKIDLDQQVAGVTQSVTKKDWNDTYAPTLGAQYQFNKTFALLAGYSYEQTPVPDKTFDPVVPDANAHLFTIGTDIKYKKTKITVGYGYQRLEGTRKDNSIDDNPQDGIIDAATSANGKYDTDIHMIGISVTYMF
ncbi:MAG: outer membrane protein transport protein [Candidatus Brocadiaceae bacterium]